MSKWERWLVAVTLLASACPKLCRAQQLPQLPMSMGTITINMPTAMLGTLVDWWRAGKVGCAYGETRADTLVIDSLHVGGNCDGAIGAVMTSPPITEDSRQAQMAYMQWVLSQRPDLLFAWAVHDTTTVQGMAVPRIWGVRRAKLPVVSS